MTNQIISAGTDMCSAEDVYCALVTDVLDTGSYRETRNAATVSKFFTTLSFDIDRFPLLTRRQMYPYGIIGEYTTFLQGFNHITAFQKNGCNYWNQFADENGVITLDYGNKWQNWNNVNQLADLIKTLKENPTDRRMIISSWDPSNLNNLSLPCCHFLYQFYVESDGRLSMIWYQRSADVMVGIPSDMIVAALMLKTIANTVGKKTGMVNMVFGDTHIYQSHLENTGNFLARPSHPLPEYICTADIYSFTTDSVEIRNYVHSGPLKFEMHT